MLKEKSLHIAGCVRGSESQLAVATWRRGESIRWPHLRGAFTSLGASMAGRTRVPVLIHNLHHAEAREAEARWV